MYYAVKLYQHDVGSTDRVVVTDFVTTTFILVRYLLSDHKNHRFHHGNGGFSNFLAQNEVGENGVGVSSGVSCRNPKNLKLRKSNFLGIFYFLENEPTKAGKIKIFPSAVSPYASNWRSRIGH